VNVAWLLAGWLGCGDATPDIDEGFRVVGLTPADGTDDARPAMIPELRLSAAADPARCDDASVRLDAVDDEEAVLMRIPIAVEVSGDGRKLRLLHREPLPDGHRYAVSTRGGATGCADRDGDDIVPFRSTFRVVPDDAAQSDTGDTP
jgi:hypothetical protein